MATINYAKLSPARVSRCSTGWSAQPPAASATTAAVGATGHQFHARGERARTDRGYAAFVRKPFQLTAVVELVASILNTPTAEFLKRTCVAR